MFAVDQCDVLYHLVASLFLQLYCNSVMLHVKIGDDDKHWHASWISAYEKSMSRIVLFHVKRLKR